MLITASANETFGWLAGRLPDYRPTRGDLALVAWWSDLNRPPPPLILRR